MSIPQIDEQLNDPKLFEEYGKNPRYFRCDVEWVMETDKYFFQKNRIQPFKGSKFLLFEYHGLPYLRLRYTRDHADSHAVIDENFRKELADSNELDLCTVKGGGFFSADKTENGAALFFGDKSERYGRFDEDLLRKLLDEKLDKRLSYQIG